MAMLLLPLAHAAASDRARRSCRAERGSRSARAFFLIAFSAVEVVGQAVYPLSSVHLPDACACDSNRELGWSSKRLICEQGSQTSCSECPHQRRCARIDTVVGDGLRSYDGNCKYDVSKNTCETPTQASLSYPVDIEFDEKDNLYIVDSGNNRVRFVTVLNANVITIAGTGELGFSGDGGLGIHAQLRFPQGIAVKRHLPGSLVSDPREVYFSDFNNQRIRKLTSDGTVLLAADGSGDEIIDRTVPNGVGTRWIITTVAGNGKRGFGCDMAVIGGCHPLHVAMHNPRGLALSPSGLLYVVDSGNRKIQEINFATNTYRTLVGTSTSELGDLSYLNFEDGRFLAGSWAESNQHVSVGSLYSVQIDRHAQLWYIDGSNNRIFVTPLDDAYLAAEVGGVAGQYLHYVMSAYTGPDNPDTGSIFFTMSRKKLYAFFRGNLDKWLIAEHLSSQESVSLDKFSMTVGTSYWKFGSPRKGSWCSYKSVQEKVRCKSVPAQFAQFKGIMSNCFDVANEMFINDMSQSEITQLGPDPKSTAMIQVETDELRMTTDNCPCLKFWVDWPIRKLDDRWPTAKCAQNPEYANATYPVGHEFAGQLVDCNVVNYCGAPDGDAVEWCYVNQTGMGETEPCRANTGQYCARAGLGIQWEAIPQASLFGNEKRAERVITVDLGRFNFISTFLAGDLWMGDSVAGELQAGGSVDAIDERTSIPKWSVLQGFHITYKGQTANRPSGCTNACCGLFPGTGIYASSCIVRTTADLEVLGGYFSTNAKMTLLWSVLENPLNMTTARMDDCKQRCALDSKCTGFMVDCQKIVREGELADCEKVKLRSQCIFFEHNYPYHIYVYSTRSQFNVSDLTQATEAERATMLKAGRSNFALPFSPQPRLQGLQMDATIGVGDLLKPGQTGLSPQIHPDRSFGTLEGPLEGSGLLLSACQNACILNALCTAIAFPGCYLLNRTDWKAQGPAHSLEPGSMVFVKKYIKEQVRGVAGQNYVNGFKGEDSKADKAVLNKPAACAVDSLGDLVFADAHNQRIRKVKNMTVDCLYMTDLFHIEELRKYERAINTAAAACSTTGSSIMTDMFGTLQKETIEKRSVAPFISALCNWTDAEPGLPTNNLIALCNACIGSNFTNDTALDPYPPTGRCPEKELCVCRNAIVEVLKTDVYLNCPLANAYFDRWHRWATAWTLCWTMESGAARFISNTTLRQELRTYLMKSGVGL